jgi:hypothetical protein
VTYYDGNLARNFENHILSFSMHRARSAHLDF